MRRIRSLLPYLLALFVLAAVTPTAGAHHSMAGGAECGTLNIDNVAFMTKGRTDSMVIRVDHRVGCKHLSLIDIVPTGNSESYGYPGQYANCTKYGREVASNAFRYYFDTEIDASTVDVSCSRYNGPD